MNHQHPMLPTREQFAEWDSEYFDGEGQNFDIMMIKAFQAGADKRLEQLLEYDLETYTGLASLIHDLREAMKQEES